MATITAALFNKISDAIRLRALGAGAATFADQTWAYDGGVITAATDNGDGTVTIEDDTKDWTFLISGVPHMRWTEATPGSNGIADWDFGSYDLVIEAPDPDYTPDPRKVVQAHISAQPSATEVKITVDVAELVAQGRITAVSDWVGRRYWILRAGGDSWIRGYFDQPNDPIVRFGRVANVVVDTGASTTTLTSDREIDGDVGYEVVYLDAGDHQRRKVITAIDAETRTITWAGTADPPVVSGTPPLREFYVVAAGAVFVWGADGGNAQSAYSGLRSDSFLGHDPDDSLVSVPMPTLTFPFLYGTDSLSCPISPTSVPIFNRPEDGRDIDLYYPQDNACGTRDTFENLRVHKSVRAWWSDLTGIAVHYVNPAADPTDRDGITSGTIPNFTIATYLYHAGVNPVSGTTGTHTGSSMPCVLATPHDPPITLWWTIEDDDGAPLLSGYHEAYDGATITGDFTADHDGKPVKASFGPTRPVPKRFGRMFDVVYFLPDIDDSGDEPVAVLPPTEEFPGTFVTRAASTHYRMASANHVVTDSTLDRHEITEDDYARLVGDQRDDPGLPALLSDPDDPQAEWHGHAYVGTRARATQARITGSRRGTATGGSAVRLVDTSKDWLDVDFYPATNGLTHAFTAASGSTTGCTIPGVSGTDLWGAGRFPGFAGPFVGFTVEFIVNGGDLDDPADFDDPAAVIDKRLIATGTTGGVITWAEATGVSVDGMAGRIVEPAVLNRWKSVNTPLVDGAADHSVTVRWPDGTTATVAILGNHDDTLFVDTLPAAVVAGCTYRINAPEMSGVYHRVDGDWFTTAGADPRFEGAVFRRKAANNAEDKFTEFGFYRPNDEPFTEPCLKDEVEAAVNILSTTKESGEWIETTNNARRGSGVPHATFDEWYDAAVGGGGGGAPDDYFDYGVKDGSGAPKRYYNVNKNGSTSFAYGGTIETLVNTLRVTLAETPYPSSLDFYSYGDVAAGLDPAMDVDVTFDDGGGGGPGGDPVLYHAWKFWDTKTATGLTTVDSARLGQSSPDAPAANIGGPTVLTGFPPTGHRWSGYVVTNWLALRRWGFPALSL